MTTPALGIRSLKSGEEAAVASIAAAQTIQQADNESDEADTSSSVQAVVMNGLPGDRAAAEEAPAKTALPERSRSREQPLHPADVSVIQRPHSSLAGPVKGNDFSAWASAFPGRVDKSKGSKPNDPAFWLQKVKSVYSCRPFDAKQKGKKQEVPFPKKSAVSVQNGRSASAASVWPVIKVQEEVFRRNGGAINNEQSPQQATALQRHRASEKREQLQASPQTFNQAPCRRPELTTTVNSIDESVKRADEHEADFCSDEVTAANASIRNRVGSADEDVRDGFEEYRVRLAEPRRRSKSVSDALLVASEAMRPHLRDGESLLLALPLNLNPAVHSESRLRNTSPIDTKKAELERVLPHRRQTWSPLLKHSSLSPVGSPKGRTGFRNKLLSKSRHGSKRHSLRSSLSRLDSTVDDLKAVGSRSSLLAASLRESQLNAERSVKVWAAENSPPRRGVESALKAAMRIRTTLSNDFARTKSKELQLERELDKLRNLSAALEQGLAAEEALARTDQELAQKLEDVEEITRGETVLSRRYEHMVARVQEDRARLRGQMDALTKQIKAAEKARVALSGRLERARAESLEAREASARGRRELGGLHTAWDQQLAEFRHESEQDEEAMRYFVRREKMRHRIMMELHKAASLSPSKQAKEVISTVSTEASYELDPAQYETLTALVGTKDVPQLIAMYGDRKESAVKLQVAKKGAEERLQLLKDEKELLEAKLNEAVYVDGVQAGTAYEGVRDEIGRKESRLMRLQDRTLAEERTLSVLATCLHQLRDKIPDPADALRLMPASLFQGDAASLNPPPVKKPKGRPVSFAKGARVHAKRASVSSRGSDVLERESLAAEGATAGVEGHASMSPGAQMRHAVDTLDQVSSRLDSWLGWETAYLQGPAISEDRSRRSTDVLDGSPRRAVRLSNELPNSEELLESIDESTVVEQARPHVFESSRRTSEKERTEAVEQARARAEHAVLAAAVQAVKERPENYRVDVGQEAFQDVQASLEAITCWLRANREQLRAHVSELDYDCSGTISKDELVELFMKVKFIPTPGELRVLMGKLDRDGSGNVTIDELLESSDDEDNAAVFRDTAAASPISRDDIKARTDKLTRSQQFNTQRPNVLDSYLSPEQSRQILEKLRAIDVPVNLLDPEANLRSTRGGTASSGSAGPKQRSMGATKVGAAAPLGRPPSEAGRFSQIARGKRASAGAGDTSRRRPESAPSKKEEDMNRIVERRHTRLAFVEPPKEKKSPLVSESTLPSRPPSALGGKVLGSASLSRPLSASAYKSNRA